MNVTQVWHVKCEDCDFESKNAYTTGTAEDMASKHILGLGEPPECDRPNLEHTVKITQTTIVRSNH